MTNSVLFDVLDNGEIQITKENMKPSGEPGGKGGTGGEKSSADLLISKGKTIAEAVRDELNGRILYGGYLKARLFTERFAESGLVPTLDYLTRDHLVDETPFLAVVKGENPERVYASDVGLSEMVGNFISDMADTQPDTKSESVYVTTLDFINLIFAFAAATYAAYKGAGTIGRLATFIVPFVMFTVILFFLMGLSMMDIKILRPVLADSTFAEMNLGAFYTGARFSEILIFLVFSFFLTKKASINKTFAKTLGTFAVFFFMVLIPTILVLGVDLAKMEFNPYFIYTRQVHAYDFIQRVQSINTLAWFPGFLLKLIIYCFMASYTLSGVFKAKSHKSFVPLITGLSFSICMIPMMQKSSVIMTLASDQIFPFIILPFTFVLPLFLPIVYVIRREKINELLEQKKRLPF